nr:MAG TPA: N-acetylmuramoyl-L-alanine amidase [Caudoviricetes sp.]
MAFTNSQLVSFTRISPYRSSREGHAIDTITIHCAAAQAAVETLGKLFQTKQASANYGIGPDGRVGLYVEEKERSWATSNGDNDRRAVTIEVACENKHPYKVNGAAFRALLDLVTDICRRNGIKKLVWSTSKADRVNHRNDCNMTVHRDYENKACPGKWLYDRHGEIAAEVNKRLMEDENMVRYKTIDEMPAWAQKEARELVDIGALKGRGEAVGYDVTEDMLRGMIINLRMCKALIAALPDNSIDKDALFAEFKKNLKIVAEVR